MDDPTYLSWAVCPITYAVYIKTKDVIIRCEIRDPKEDPNKKEENSNNENKVS